MKVFTRCCDSTNSLQVSPNNSQQTLLQTISRLGKNVTPSSAITHRLVKTLEFLAQDSRSVFCYRRQLPSGGGEWCNVDVCISPSDIHRIRSNLEFSKRKSRLEDLLRNLKSKKIGWNVRWREQCRSWGQRNGPNCHRSLFRLNVLYASVCLLFVLLIFFCFFIFLVVSRIVNAVSNGVIDFRGPLGYIKRAIEDLRTPCPRHD